MAELSFAQWIVQILFIWSILGPLAAMWHRNKLAKEGLKMNLRTALLAGPVVWIIVAVCLSILLSIFKGR